MSSKRERWTVGRGILTLAMGGCLLLAGAAQAGELSEAEQAALERAQERHATAVERAEEAYRRALAQANEELERRYAAVIERYEGREAEAMVASLRDRLEGQLVEVPGAGGAADGAAGAVASGQAAAANQGDEARHEGLIESIGPRLVQADRELVDTEMLSERPYVLLYFSASWCGPCQRFTPDLKAFYEEHYETGLFEVVLVGRDRSNREMLQYMHQTEMPWLAIPYAQIGRSGVQDDYGGRGIPNLVVVDGDGEAVARSYVDGNYVGPRQVLRQMDQIIQEHEEGSG